MADLEIEGINVATTLTKALLLVPKCKSTTSSPTTTDDSAAGYDVGDIWVNTTLDVGFVCVDNTASAAAWVSTTSPAAMMKFRNDVARYYDGTHGIHEAVYGTASRPTAYLRGSPVYMPEDVTLIRLGLEVTTGTGAGPPEWMRLGVYTDNQGLPDSLLLDSGELDIKTTGFKEVTISLALSAGWYWMLQSSSDTFSMRTLSGSSDTMGGLGNVASTGTDSVSYFFTDHTFGALPSTIGGTPSTSSGGAPRIRWRI